MDRGIEQSFMVNRVGTGDTTQKLSPDRTSTKSNSTNSSNSAIGIQDKKTPFLIGVAGGTASGKVYVEKKYNFRTESYILTTIQCKQLRRN